MIAAEQYACHLVVPSSQQFGAKRWPSHKDHAAKALQKLAGPHLPATLKQLERAIAQAYAEHDKATNRRDTTRPAAAGETDEPETEPAAAADEVHDDELDVDEREDDLEDEDLDDAMRFSDDQIDEIAGARRA